MEELRERSDEDLTHESTPSWIIYTPATCAAPAEQKPKANERRKSEPPGVQKSPTRPVIASAQQENQVKQKQEQVTNSQEVTVLETRRKLLRISRISTTTRVATWEHKFTAAVVEKRETFIDWLGDKGNSDRALQKLRDCRCYKRGTIRQAQYLTSAFEVYQRKRR